MSREKSTVLIVDDETKILEVMNSFLEAEGFRTITAKNGRTALKLFETVSVDLVILDIMLPDINGIELCRTIRKNSKVPIIMLTARIGEDDTVTCLDLGADDYVTKPFSPRALMGRVRAVMRRYAGDSQIVAEVLAFQNGRLEVNCASHEVKINGKIVGLTPVEFKIIQVLAKNPKKVFTRDELIQVIYGYDYEGNDRSIDTHIKNLRYKVELDPRKPDIIVTVHGIGYRFGGC